MVATSPSGPTILGLSTATAGAIPHHDGCAVLQGTFALSIQALLFIMSTLTLIVKWKLEKPPRTWLVFFRDGSKQIFASGVIHCWNLALAIVFHNQKVANADECSWYWINIMIDTTVGVGINYFLLRLTEKYLGYSSGKYQDVISGQDSDETEAKKKSGHYHDVPISPSDERDLTLRDSDIPRGLSAISGTSDLEVGIRRSPNLFSTTWAYQIGIWLIVVSIMKLIVAFTMFVLSPMWAFIGTHATSWVPGGPDGRLLFVMIVTPITMNCFQFWVQDSFLKWKAKQNVAIV